MSRWAAWPRRIVIAGLCAAAALIASRPAEAAGFLQKPGEGIAIVTSTFSDAVRAYDEAGRLVPVKHWRKFELSTYAEYGLTDGLTLIASPSLFVFRQPAPGHNRPATGIAEIGGRAKIVEWSDNVISAQASLRAPLAGSAARPYADTRRGAQVDARLGWGSSFELAGFRTFSDLAIGVRTDGILGHQLRVDATLGFWPRDDVLVLLQSFTASTPRSTRRVVYLQPKAQLSAVWWVTPSVGLQVGGLVAMRGVNSSADRGAFSAVWYRF